MSIIEECSQEETSSFPSKMERSKAEELLKELEEIGPDIVRSEDIAEFPELTGFIRVQFTQ